MINKVIILGNLGKDPEVRHLESGASVAKFPVATNESYKDKSGEWQTVTEWHNVVAWRALADRAEKQLKKGSLVYVEGKLTTRKWQDQNGNDRYTTEIVAYTIKSLEKRESTGGYGDNFPNEESPSTSPPSSTQPAATQPDADDDLPF